jgi:hypothetical protein
MVISTQIALCNSCCGHKAGSLGGICSDDARDAAVDIIMPGVGKTDCECGKSVIVRVYDLEHRWDCAYPGCGCPIVGTPEAARVLEEISRLGY